MYNNIIENLIHYAWQPVLLLSVLWTILAVIFIFVRYQLKKEKVEQVIINQQDLDKEAFSREIDELAIFVSKLPRPKNIIREYRNEELENGND